MPNKLYNDTTMSGPKGGKVNMDKGGKRKPVPMRTAKFPGLPGKTQPGDRSLGFKKCKCHPQQEGI